MWISEEEVLEGLDWAEGQQKTTAIVRARSGAWTELVAVEWGEENHLGDGEMYPSPSGWVPQGLGLGFLFFVELCTYTLPFPQLYTRMKTEARKS